MACSAEAAPCSLPLQPACLPLCKLTRPPSPCRRTSPPFPQYWASGALEGPLLGAQLGPLPALDALLCAAGVAHWWLFDGTRQGLGMAALTAVCGPLVEIALIYAGLYQYTHPVILHVPTWIPWVYFCGGAAVGNLGRKVSRWAVLADLAPASRQ